MEQEINNNPVNSSPMNSFGEEKQNVFARCVNCGTPLAEGENVCHVCGKNQQVTGNGSYDYPIGTVVNTAYPEAPARCVSCGNPLAVGQKVCLACGKNQLEAKKKKTNRVIFIVIALVLLAAAGAVTALILIFGGKSVESIVLLKTEINMDIGDSESLIFTITPDDAKNKTVKWSSSNESVATVDEEGKITAVEAGVCIITVKTNNGKTDTCRVTVNEHIPNFTELFNEYQGEDWCEIGSDGSWMTLDTNPLDLDSDSSAFTIWYYTNYNDVEAAIKNTLNKLGFRESVRNSMGNTTALQGKQTEENEKYKVTWSYHPDHGLEILFEIKGK